MIVTTEEQKQDLIEAGKRLGSILRAVSAVAVPGARASELNDLAQTLIQEGGDEPSFLGYTPEGARRPYPAALCVSINDEVVHGIPNESEKVLKEGDIVGLDLGLTHKGIVVDAAVTVAVGEIDRQSRELMEATKRALAHGIAAASLGGRVGDIGAAIQETFKGTAFSVVRELCGHGVGNRVHEDPEVPNYGTRGAGPELVSGMVLALEPIANAGGAGVRLASDGYTFCTRDGSRSAHFEHTILIERDGTRIITE